MIFSVDDIARVCYGANCALQSACNEVESPAWEYAQAWQTRSYINAVRFRLANLDVPISAQHEAWLADKIADGWVKGHVKDDRNKKHPCIVPFEELTDEQRMKDRVFVAIVRAMAPSLSAADLPKEEPC